VDDNPTAQILEERIRDINITNIASENNINKADLIAVLQSGGFQGPPGPPGPPGDKGDSGSQGPPGPSSGSSGGSGRPPRPGRSGGPASMDEASDSAPNDKRPPDDPPPPPPPKMMAMANPNAQAYAQNLQLQAEIQGIREEMQKQAKQAQIAQEVQNRLIAANTNPRTEIIRELQTIIQPTVPLPQAPAQHNDLMRAFEQAMANQNHALGKTLERMGMSMAEFVEHMKEKDKKPVEDPVVTGSSQQPPPPPPPSGAAVEYSIATPRVPRSRSRSGVPDPIPARSPSVASTIRYPSMGPEPEPPRAQIARTIAREELARSRSRGGPPEPILPIAEEEVVPRGRQMTRKPEGPMAEKAKALLRKQEQGISMGEARIHLGRFAKSFAQVKQKAKNAEKAASVPPPQKHKTYDDIEKEIEEVVPDPMDTRLRKKPQFPTGAFLKRERLDSEGRKSLRYQGMPIRV
jgi:hypothetical protein